jgi:hypothetical protein
MQHFNLSDFFQEKLMLYYAVVFFIIAVVEGSLGFKMWNQAPVKLPNYFSSSF